MKKLVFYVVLLFSFANLMAQDFTFIPAPEGYGLNTNCDDRAMTPFFQDDTYVYCTTRKVITTNPLTRRAYIVRVAILDGSQFVYPEVYLPSNLAFNAKKLGDAIFFNIGIRLCKINTKTNALSILSNDAEDYALFDHYVVYENSNYAGTYILDLNTNATTEILSPNNKRLYRLGASYYDNGLFYFRSQYIINGVHYGVYKYNPSTKSISEIVGANVLTGSDVYADDDEVVRVNDNLLFLMKDVDYNYKYYSINLTNQSLNTSFTYTTKSVYSVGNLLVFNNTVYLANRDGVSVSDGVSAPQLTSYPYFSGIGNKGFYDNFLYLNQTAYTASYTAEFGTEIWKYDGTLNGKKLVKDITPGSESSFSNFTAGFLHNDKLFYTVNTGPLSYSVYVTDGTAEGTSNIIAKGRFDTVLNIFPHKNALYFYGTNSTQNGLYVLNMETLSNKDFAKATEVVFYPNPVKDYAYFKTNEKVSKVEIYDSAGRILNSVSVNENKVNLSTLQAGSYILRIYAESGVTNVKLLKE